MNKSKWKVGYSSATGKYVPVPLFGDMNYRDAKAECNRLNKIKADAKQKSEKKQD